MKINEPGCITPRLMAGFKIGDGYVGIERTKNTGRIVGKPAWKYAIDAGEKEYEAEDLYGWGDTQEMMGSLLSFLQAAAEAYSPCNKTPGHTDDNYGFPEWVCEWAYQNEDEISWLTLLCEETWKQYLDSFPANEPGGEDEETWGGDPDALRSIIFEEGDEK